MDFTYIEKRELEYLDGSILIWLIRLRWVALVGQSLAILLFSYFFNYHFKTELLISVFAASFISNLYLQNIKRAGRKLLALILALDITCLSLLLYSCGGASNPFSIVYLVHVALAAVILGKTWTWCMAGLTSVFFALLFFYYQPLPHELQHNHGGGFSAHLQGMWLAYTLVAVLVAYFLTKIISTVKAKENYIEVLRNKQAKLAAITTLAAGAAHELSTPLATVSLIINDLENSIGKPELKSEAMQDLQVIQSELKRCKKIIQEMSGNTENSIAEVPKEITVQELKKQILEKINIYENRVEVHDLTKNPSVRIAEQGFIYNLANLIKNALSASSENQPVIVQIRDNEKQVFFNVIDSGCGIPADKLDRIGEPFFTTKEPGEGMGLGVFLARVFSERFGGSLLYESKPGAGTKAILSLPLIQQ